MARQHTSTKTTTSATDFYNYMMKVILHRSTSDPPDIYVECEVRDIPPCEECQEFDCFGCEYKGGSGRHE